MNRALLVGINAYPGAPLLGCVNDINDVADFLSARCGFVPAEIRRLQDAQATKTAIVQQLAWLIAGVSAGDRILFHYSGHGVQLPTLDAAGEVDGLDECICPVDFDWTEPHAIRDKEFARIFAAIPAGVEFIWISDSCHSADLLKLLQKHPGKPRTIPPPQWIAKQTQKARDAHFNIGRIARTAVQLNGALLAGCRSDQTSADTSFNGRPSGAFTYYLLETLKTQGGLIAPLQALLPGVVAALAGDYYAQQPQLEGSVDVKARAFLAI